MNLAQSLLDACERHPELEAFPGIGYGELLPRVARIAGGLGVEPGARVAVVLDNRLETALLYWACQWAGAVCVPLSWRLSEEELAYCVDDAGAAVVIRDGDPLPDGPPHDGALGRDDREISLLLYTSGTTGRPKGVPRSHAADRAGGLSQALQHGYHHGDRTLGVMPLYHTMGIHSLLAMHLVGGCYVPQARWDPDEALELIERERITSLYLAPTLFHDLLGSDRLPEHDVSSVRALGYAGAAMTSTVVGALRRGLRAGGVREPLRLDRGLHLLDRRRPALEAGLRRPAGAQHAAEARARRRDLRPPLRATRPSRATGTGPTPTPRRFATAGTTPATPATSMPTATSGSTAGSTT